MRVAICDDNQQDIERIRRYTLRMIDYAVEYVFYTRPEELLRECADAEQKPDMYILDIEMPGMDGLAVAKQIRETDSKALLVFLTSYTKYMPSVFEVVTFDFIPKPISEERLRVLFEKAGTYLNLTNQSFSFSYRRVRYSLKFDEILYLEKRGRQAIIHTKKMKYQSNMNLNEIWEKLDERMFAAVHGSFIVNLKHVHSVSSGMVMLTDGTELGVTRGYRKELTESTSHLCREECDMALYGVRLVINLFDLCIYRRYLEEFIGNRKTSMEFSVLLLIVCELIGSAVNQMGISWLNFVTMVAILCVYVCQYEAGILSRLIAVLLYMGIMGVAEPLGYLFNKAFMEKVLDDTTVSYYFIVFFMALLKATIVEVFCRLKSGKSIRLSAMPKETQYMLTMIPLCSLISCFLLIEVAKELISAQMVVLCMCIIFVIIITNYVIFLMIEKYTTVEEKQHEEEMIQREILYRNEYYQDMERYQEQIQDIRHDMKNRLTGLLAAAEQGSAELIKDRLQEVLGDIRLAEEIIYSANPVVNAILKVKSVKAKEKEIPMQVTTLLPQRVSVDIGDMGVLYGNLLDNAIEAAMAVEQEKRYVHVESKFQEGRLLLSIKNSKPSGTSSCQQTSKKDKIKHGRGIRSVRKVAEKYGGELMLKDQGEHFEAVLLLNGVAKLE